MVLLHLFDESQMRLADFGYIPECKSKNLRGLNEILLPLARMSVTPVASMDDENPSQKGPTPTGKNLLLRVDPHFEGRQE